MSKRTTPTKFERTPEQKAEERRLRELHRAQPLHEMPADTLRGENAAKLLKLIAVLRRERETQGITLNQLAKRIGLEPEMLAQWESGQAFNPTISTLFRLAHALGKCLNLHCVDATSENTPAVELG